MKGHLYNMISGLKNGQIVRKSFILQENTNICRSLLNILWDEGLILGYKIFRDSNKLKIYLKYTKGNPVINNIKVVSKPSLRTYYSVKELRKIEDFLILTTNKGLKTIKDCKKSNVGGEPLIRIK